MSALRVWQFRLSRRLGRLITWCAAIATLGRMPPFVSAAALVVEGDRILVVVDPIRHEPVLPGGHLKWRESPWSAVVREVREETGYIVEPTAILSVRAGEELGGEPGTVRVLFSARLRGGEMTSSPEGEARWMPLKDLADGEFRDSALIRLALAMPGGAARGD